LDTPSYEQVIFGAWRILFSRSYRLYVGIVFSRLLASSIHDYAVFHRITNKPQLARRSR